MLEALDVKLEQRSEENFISEILGSVMRGLSMTELVDELIRNLPIEPDDYQRGVIETTAEQLYVIEQPDIEENDEYFTCREILEDIVDEILLTKGEPKTVIARMINKLVQQLPVEFLKERSSTEIIIKKMSTSGLDFKSVLDEINHLLFTNEAREVLEEIIRTVYDIGIDYLYFIKDD